jgi:hypothetical protein
MSLTLRFKFIASRWRFGSMMPSPKNRYVAGRIANSSHILKLHRLFLRGRYAARRRGLIRSATAA